VSPADSNRPTPASNRFEKVARLPKEEKEAILLLIDSVVAKQTIRQVMGS
jgi:hypothetical protein